MDGGRLQAAFALHTRRYGDSSLLVELLTREQGRLSCVAKGALRSGRAGVQLQPFQPLQVGLRGRGEVLTLSKSEPGGNLLPLQGRSLYCGLYVNELVQRLTVRHDGSPALFDDYVEVIVGLGGGAALEPPLRRFELRLLGHLGLGLVLEQDSCGAPIIPSSRYTYDVESGPVRTVPAAADSVSGATLMALRRSTFDDPTVLREARRLMRHVIDYHLDGRPLRSRELFR